MACSKCEERRKKIAKMLKEVGKVASVPVNGVRRIWVGDPLKDPQKRG